MTSALLAMFTIIAGGLIRLFSTTTGRNPGMTRLISYGVMTAGVALLAMNSVHPDRCRRGGRGTLSGARQRAPAHPGRPRRESPREHRKDVGARAELPDGRDGRAHRSPDQRAAQRDARGLGSLPDRSGPHPHALSGTGNRAADHRGHRTQLRAQRSPRRGRDALHQRDLLPGPGRAVRQHRSRHPGQRRGPHQRGAGLRARHPGPRGRAPGHRGAPAARAAGRPRSASRPRSSRSAPVSRSRRREASPRPSGSSPRA